MEKILTLGKAETSFVNALGFEFIQLPRFITDEDRHDFVLNTLKSKEFDKLIILIDGDEGYEGHDGLKLGLHIRLTIDLHQKRLVPILYVSPDTLAVILRDAGAWGRILTTKGCKLAKPDVQAVQAGIDFPPLSPAEVGPFLTLIQLRPDETVGRHSLANQWGAYALDKAAGTRALRNSPVLAKAQKQLYFKYVEANNHKWEKPDSFTNISNENKPKYERIYATGKKILLIDDEAEIGWSDVLKELFRKSNSKSEFHVLNRKIDGWKSFYDEEKKLILDTGFDLFLIDLRLTGSEEEDIAKPEDFSGTDVMRQIKQHNAGNQVIMFTASNKAWNLKALLDFGADGYYIKESPEYNFPDSFSNENLRNFKVEAELCLSYSFLKEIWAIHEDIKSWLQNDSVRGKYTSDQHKNLNQIRAQIIIAYRLLRIRQSQNVSYFALTYVRILEILSELFVRVDESTNSISLNSGNELNYCFWDKSKNEYELQLYDPVTVKWNSYKSIGNQTRAIACQQFLLDKEMDKLTLRQVDSLIQSRNDFVHEGKEVRLHSTTLVEWAKAMKKLLTCL